MHKKNHSMKWFALLGFLLFFGVSVAPSINADVKEQDIVEPITVEDEQYQRLMELATSIANSYDTTTSEEDCGCEDDSSEFQRWNFTGICWLLTPLLAISILFRITLRLDWPYNILMAIGSVLNCFWV